MIVSIVPIIVKSGFKLSDYINIPDNVKLTLAWAFLMYLFYLSVKFIIWMIR